MERASISASYITETVSTLEYFEVHKSEKVTKVSWGFGSTVKCRCLSKVLTSVLLSFEGSKSEQKWAKVAGSQK